MRGYFANTDFEWFTFLCAIEPPVDEVNFWKPGTGSGFRALVPGEPLFFKLKAPHNAIGGFGYFSYYSTLPITMVWEVYRVANGAATYGAFRERILRLRQRFSMERDPALGLPIGCILLTGCIFFDDGDWVRVPGDWAPNIVGGKGYDLAHGEGQRVWIECLGRAATIEVARPRSHSANWAANGSSIADRPLGGGFGEPAMVRPRLGQRSFRIAVLDSDSRRCAITNEKTLPALEAAHIRDYSSVHAHELSNGILFRADIHKLFDSGYVTVTPDYHFEVSKRIKEEFENGRDYYSTRY